MWEDSPTLLVWGDHDPVGAVEVARATASLIPDAQFELPPAGHVPWPGNPDRVPSCCPISSAQEANEVHGPESTDLGTRGRVRARGGIAGLFDRFVLARGVRRAFQGSFAAMERELGPSAHEPASAPPAR